MTDCGFLNVSTPEYISNVEYTILSVYLNSTFFTIIHFLVYWNKLEEIDKRWTEISPYFLDCNYTLPEARKANVSRQVLDYYFEPREKINRKNFNKFTQVGILKVKTSVGI